MFSDDKAQAISASEAKLLFASWKRTPALVLAVSGGPDSVAMMLLAARWRAAMKKGPRLLAVTIDHGLRAASAREARNVKLLARTFGLEHRTLRWVGVKPKAGLPAAARAARYELLARAARSFAATHVLTAHTRDDQAETFIMRMSRGSGIAGLAAMMRETHREGIVLARPFLDIPKARLVATLRKAGIAYADDPSNRDPAFTRSRLRALMPALAAEGADARNLARLASRLGRSNAALERMTDGAERYLAHIDAKGRPSGFGFSAFSALPDEIRIRLLMRAVDRVGHEGPVELGKAETLLQAIDGAFAAPGSDLAPRRFRQTLAGALVTCDGQRIYIAPAPQRRR